MKVLVFAPHPDDEILGVGGSIAKYISLGHDVCVCIVTCGKPPIFTESEAKKVRNETDLAHRFLGITETIRYDFPAVMIEKCNRYKVNDALQKVISNTKPDIVYIPHCYDIQKDHQIVAEAAMVALRPKHNNNVKKIYAYETLSETEWNISNSVNAFTPTTWNDISGFLDIKIEAMKKYESQLASFPNPRSIEAIQALAKYRGSNICIEAAEAFVNIRTIE